MSDSRLTSSDLVIVFAQALAGLGHLRVSDALYHGLPTGAHAVLLGSEDKNITFIHNLTSQNLLLRRVVEYFESGDPQDVFAFLYRRYLQANTDTLELQLKTILDRHPQTPKTILVVATHFGLAHQFAALKERFMRLYGVRIVLAVVVTDDSPIHIWAVGGADVMVVPSTSIKIQLESYAHMVGLSHSEYVVLPYMLSPRLIDSLPAADARVRRGQLDPAKKSAIHVAVPIAGAAVQLSYLQSLIRSLSEASDRFHFHVVSKISSTTESFLKTISKYKKVELIVSEKDREVVDLYEKLYEKEVIGLEITKPSEQSFKALISPKKRGGPVLLFSDPVGRQEWDNLAFLERHGLIPNNASQMRVWKFDDATVAYSREELEEVRVWRGLRLPTSGEGSAKFILWALGTGVFQAMANFSGYPQDTAMHDDGVAKFWAMIADKL